MIPNLATIAPMFKYMCKRTPGVEFHDIVAVPSTGGQNYDIYATINGAFFRAHLAGRDLERTSHDRDAVAAVIAAPSLALQKLFDDGVAEGVRKERESEFARLREENQKLREICAKHAEPPPG